MQLAILFCIATSAFGQLPAPMPVRPPGGAGAYPLSLADGSAWFIQTESDAEKTLTALVYLQGTPGWIKESVDWKWQVAQNPATIDMVVGKVPIHLKYWKDTDEIEVQGQRFKRTHDNVFFISAIESANQKVISLGFRNLTFPSDSVPSIVLLRRDPDVWSAVTGHPVRDHPLNKWPGTPSEILAWQEEGLRLIKSESAADLKKGCELFRRAAERGYAPSQYELGYCYESGKGAEQSYPIANQWYEKAALQGHVDAQYKLGHSYRTGRGEKIDLPVALAWYKKAAESGDVEGLNNVGWMYSTGQGTPADPAEAYRWLLRAAQHGDPNCQFDVARRLREGDGVGKDLSLAYSWLLVLKAQQSDFPPDSWAQVQTVIDSVGGQLDAAAKSGAAEQSKKWIGMVSGAQMESYAKQ
jgi:TPR repeat protein